MKNLNKKIGVVVLSGLALVGGSFAAVGSVAHAGSIDIDSYYQKLKQENRKSNLDRIVQAIKNDRRLAIASSDYVDEDFVRDLFEKQYGKKIEYGFDFEDADELLYYLQDFGLSAGLFCIKVGDSKFLLNVNKDIPSGINWSIRV